MQVLFLQALFYQVLSWAFSSHAGLFRELLHLYLALFFRRDDFFRSVSSPACSFSPQG